MIHVRHYLDLIQIIFFKINPKLNSINQKFLRLEKKHLDLKRMNISTNGLTNNFLRISRLLLIRSKDVRKTMSSSLSEDEFHRMQV